MVPISIVAAYRFVDLPDAAALRDSLFASAQAAGLKGTVLVAEEGINFSLAGAQAALRGWMAELQRDARFRGLDAKWHGAAAVPFRHLRVKLKREIIRMNQPAVRPAPAARRASTPPRSRAGSNRAAATKAGRW